MQLSVPSSHHSETDGEGSVRHSPEASFRGAPTVRTGKAANSAVSETASQKSSDIEYEDSEHSEAVWLSRAQSRVEELRKLFNLPPSEVCCHSSLYTLKNDVWNSATHAFEPSFALHIIWNV